MSNIVLLSFSLDVQCPECEHDFDVSDQDDENVISGLVFTNRWEEIKGHSATCPSCDHKFILDGIEY